MRGSLAKAIRKETAPREMIQNFTPVHISRGRFFRLTTHREYAQVRKSTTNRRRIRWGKNKDGERIKLTVVPQIRLKECPRKTAQVAKQLYKRGVR